MKEFFKKAILTLILIFVYVTIDVYLFENNTSTYVWAVLSMLTVDYAYIKNKLYKMEAQND